MSDVNHVTAVRGRTRYTGDRRNRGPAMENKFDLPTIIAAVFVAGYAAILMEYVAQDDLGFSTAQIRHIAMIAAALVGMCVAMGMLRSNPDRIE